MTITFGSLFAGIGGLDLGLERAGMVCKWQVEIDDYATKVLKKHWPDVPKYRDIRGCGRCNLSEVDVICGGPPCQPASNSGLRLGESDERWLWGETIRVVRELRPEIAVLENPTAMLTLGGGSAFGRIIGEMADFGYDAEWDVLSAGALGAVHERKRLFLVAYPNGSGREVLVRDWKFGNELFRVGPAEGWPTATPHTRDSIIAWMERQSLDEPPILRDGSGIPNRVDRLRCLGNAVVPQVAQFIGECIMNSLEQP